MWRTPEHLALHFKRILATGLVLLLWAGLLGNSCFDILNPPDDEPRQGQIVVIPNPATIQGTDGTAQLYATTLDPDGHPVEHPALDWRSLDPSVATVSQNGTVAAQAVGLALIAIACGNCEYRPDTVTVEVVESPPPNNTALPAFPGAEGYGALALSELDRSALEVLFVTNLNDSGAGSLRRAIADSDPNRLSVVVFRTGGTITLSSGLSINKPNLYIAGQTAPGGGIQLYRNGESVMSIDRDGQASNIVIRYVRFRSDKGTPGRQDVITVLGGSDIVFDHVSTQFGNDEVFSLTPPVGVGPGIDRVTIQRSIVAAGLREHSAGSIIGVDLSESPDVDRVSLHHNLYAHNGQRNPRVGHVEHMQLVNNVVYNWKNRAVGIHEGAGIDVVRNYFKAGPWTGGKERAVLEHDPDGPLSTIYAVGNIAEPFQPDPDADQRRLFRYRVNETPLPSETFSSSARSAPAVSISATSANAAYASVLADVGANARLSCDGGWVLALDDLDRLIIEHVETDGGPATDDEADHPSDYGGVPTLDAGTACSDVDRDGLPDAYEERHGLRANDSSDMTLDSDGDGYTNLEEYLNGTQP